MKTIEELTQEQLRYLRQKWSSEIIELNRSKVRAQKRLDKRMEKQSFDMAEIAVLASQLEKAENLLRHLQDTNAPAELIATQVEVATKLQKEYDEESMGLNTLTDEEAFIQQLEIDELEQRKTIRQNKITEIEALIE